MSSGPATQEGRTPMRPRVVLFIWFALSGIGATLIALPDSDQRLVTFSSEHGPALVDSIGALVLILASSLLITTILRGRAAVAAELLKHPSRLGGLSFLGGLGLGLLIAGVFTEFWWWWLVGAGLIQVLQLVLWGVAFTGWTSARGSSGASRLPPPRR